MNSKYRSKSQLKIGYEIDPNKCSTNFNKKNQIGFKLKLLENLRNSKKTIEKFEEKQNDNNNNCINTNESDNLNSVSNKYIERLKYSGKIKHNKAYNNIEDKKKQANNISNTNNLNYNNVTSSRSKEKHYSHKTILNQNNINSKYYNYDLNNALNNKDSLTSKNTENNKMKLNLNDNNANNKDIKHRVVVLDYSNRELITEINTDFSCYVNKHYPIDKETKILEVWIELENNLNDNKSIKNQIIKIMYIYNKYINYSNIDIMNSDNKQSSKVLENNEKTPTYIQSANCSFYKLLKIILASAVACLFLIIYVGYDNNLKAQIKKLVSCISKSLFKFYELFDIKELCENKISDVFYDKYYKLLIKSYKINKIHLKQNDVIGLFVKDVDNSGLSLKQFSK